MKYKNIMFAADTGASGGEDKKEDAAPVETKSLEELFDKFSARKNAPLGKGGTIDSDATKKVIEAGKSDAIRQDEEDSENKEKSQEVRERIEKDREKKKPGSNVPHIIEEKRKAESERDELKRKVEEYETKLKPSLEGQIAELQKKIDTGALSESKEREYTSRITSLESTLRDREAALVNENQQLKSRLSVHDLTEDEGFKKNYLEPVAASYNQAIASLVGDKKKIDTFNRAIVVHSQSIKAETQEEKQKFAQERDDMLAAIAGDMNQFSGNRFSKAVIEYMEGSERYAKALSASAETKASIDRERAEARDRAIADRLQTWDGTYERLKDQYSDDETLTEEQKKIAIDLGFDPDSESRAANHLAKQTIAGQTELTDAIGMVHAGRVRPMLKIKIKILEREIKERDALIAKLRGNSTTGGDETNYTETAKKKPTTDEWMDKFRPQKR